MRTTIDINDEIIDEVMAKSGAKTKKSAVETALRDYLKSKKREELKNLVGNYDDFTLTHKELKKMRHAR